MNITNQQQLTGLKSLAIFDLLHSRKNQTKNILVYVAIYAVTTIIHGHNIGQYVPKSTEEYLKPENRLMFEDLFQRMIDSIHQTLQVCQK